MYVYYLLLSAFYSCLALGPNIVVILTDDQDLLLDSLVPMHSVDKLLRAEGVLLNNAFVNTPVCCPSRSTILTGKYLHNTGVRNNTIAGNCSSKEWQNNHEPFTFVSLFKNANYTTFYAGKYLNEYGNKDCGGTEHVPLGYDWWIGLKGNSRYYDYTLSINGTAKQFSNQYLTDVMKNYALNFLNQRHIQNNPFLLMLSTPAAHAPFTSAPRHRNEFLNVTAKRTPSFNYSSEDKHWLLRLPPKTLPTDANILDSIQKHRFQTLLAVDEMVFAVVMKLKEMRVLNNTFIFFTSDNGFHIGQFAQPWDKRQPYETDIRIPLIIRGPGVKKNRISTLPVSAVDFAPTLLNMAGIKSPEDMDGRSFYNEMLNNNVEYKIILIEYYGEGNSKSIDSNCPWAYDDNLTECSLENWCKCQDSRNNTFACLRAISESRNFKFCQFADDESFIEAYDLLEDPYELSNIHHNMSLTSIEEYKNMLRNLQHCRGITCHAVFQLKP